MFCVRSGWEDLGSQEVKHQFDWLGSCTQSRIFPSNSNEITCRNDRQSSKVALSVNGIHSAKVMVLMCMIRFN
jgi:hypothetical protein